MTQDDDTVEGFLSNVKQLDQQAQNEDLKRSQLLREGLESRALGQRSYQSSDIVLPRLKARKENNSGLVNSESIQDFNSQISSDYRVDLDSLAYESAYNYEKFSKSRTSSPQKADATIEIESSSKEELCSYDEPKYKPKPRDDMPDIIKFDDFVTRRSYKPSGSRYSKFEVSDDKRKEIDQTLSDLMGTSLTLNKDEDNDEGSPPSNGRNNDWRSDAKSKPKLAPPVKTKPNLPIRPRDYDSEELKPSLPKRIQHSYDSDEDKPALPRRRQQESSDLNSLKKSPRKFGLSDTSSSSYSDILKKSPVKLNFSKFSSSSTKVEPEIKSKPDTLKSKPLVKAKPELDTSSDNPFLAANKRPTFMDSLINNSTSTNQSLGTESKIKINPSAKNPKNSWLDSAQRNTPSSRSSDIVDRKIKIPQSDSNSLSKNQSHTEGLEQKRSSTLKELKAQKLQHVADENKINPKEPKIEKDFNFKSLPLKKTRPSVPSKPTKLSTTSESSDVEFLKKKLNSSATTQSTERKVSNEPEALKKSKSLKPPVPKRKPSVNIPEAIALKGQLKQNSTAVAKPISEKPEGLVQLKNLKPSKPLRKPSVKELEALENLKKIKAKSSVPPVKPKNERVVSQSKEVLQSQIGRLKSVKSEKSSCSKQIKEEESSSSSSSSSSSLHPAPVSEKDEYKNNLQQLFLKRAHSLDDSKPAPLKTSTRFNSPKKAATFDSSTNEKDQKLDHINASRSRGPKRRAPKSIK